MGMTIQTAQAWMRLNHEEFARLVRIGHAGAVKVQEAWWAAKKARDARTSDFGKLRDYWLDLLNEFIIEEMNLKGRIDLQSKFGYKLGDVDASKRKRLS
jgi:hypothetical protein